MMNNEDLNIKAASTVRGLRLHAKAPSYDAIELPIETHPLRPLRPGEVLVEIHAAAVNPSDLCGVSANAWPRFRGPGGGGAPGADWKASLRFVR